jgi:YD repeat-containing protein
MSAAYNAQSQLTAEVRADGPNRFDFALKSR